MITLALKGDAATTVGNSGQASQNMVCSGESAQPNQTGLSDPAGHRICR
jgi:hypothetical protein